MAGGAALDEGIDFEQHRRYLSSVAYRLLGSLADAEDAVQDAWLRWRSVDRSSVKDARAYLTTVVTRICYDQLGSARARREAYYGEWLPEPSLDETLTPEDQAALGESVSYAVLAVMEQLSPAERVAFVLHDVFGVSFDEIAESLGRTSESTRQLASRGRRRVREFAGQDAAQRSFRPDAAHRAEHRKVVEAFAAATLNGDIPALMEVLDPDVAWHSDGGGIVKAGVQPVLGREKVVRLVGGMLRWLRPGAGLQALPAEVNGGPGLKVVDRDGALAGVMAFEIADGRIVKAYTMVNPEKLSRSGDGAVSALLPRHGKPADAEE